MTPTRYPGEWEQHEPHGTVVVRAARALMNSGDTAYVRGWKGPYAGGDPITTPCASLEEAFATAEALLALWSPARELLAP